MTTRSQKKTTAEASFFHSADSIEATRIPIRGTHEGRKGKFRKVVMISDDSPEEFLEVKKLTREIYPSSDFTILEQKRHIKIDGLQVPLWVLVIRERE